MGIKASKNNILQNFYVQVHVDFTRLVGSTKHLPPLLFYLRGNMRDILYPSVWYTIMHYNVTTAADTLSALFTQNSNCSAAVIPHCLLLFVLKFDLYFAVSKRGHVMWEPTLVDVFIATFPQ